MLGPVERVPRDAGPRVLPIRLAPVPDEAFDSWLDRYAARLQARLVDVVEAVGLIRPARRHDGRTPATPNWTVALRRTEVERIAHAAGVDTKLLGGLTLQRYDGIAVLLDLQTRRVRRSRLWGRGSGSRFCPACLAETGGRWPLTWRLSWSFCCLRHRVLLVDHCPRCGRAPRSTRPPMRHIPQPGRCGAPSRRSDGAVGAFAERCGYELAESRAEPVDALDGILGAQVFINGLLDRTDRAGAAGALDGVTLSTVEVFSDLKAVAGGVLTVLAEVDLEQLPPAIREQLGSVGVARRTEGRRTRHGFLAPRTAARMAVAVSKAAEVVAAPDIDTAADRVGWVIERMRRRGPEINPTSMTASWGACSPVLQAVVLRALDSTLRPSDRLRYRTATSHPRYPQSETAADGIDARAAKLPQQLWPAWALRLMPPSGHHFPTFRRVASTALLLPGGRRPVEALLPVLGQPFQRRTVDHVMGKLADSGDLDTVVRILTMLTSRIDDAQVPIDYQRRRRLFGSSVLLPDGVWKACCAQVGVAATEHQRRHAERYLLELLTGSPDSPNPPLGPLTRKDAVAYSAFCTSLWPALAELLRATAEQQLAAHRLNEPLAWEPPFDWVDAPTWPGPHVGSIQPAELRRLLIDERRSISEAAAVLGTTEDHVRLMLVRHPMGPLKRPHAPPRRQRPIRRANPTPEYVAYRHEQCGWSLQRIANDTKVSRHRVRQLAALAGVQARPPGRPRQYHIDPRWLAEQYLVQRRNLVDIAAELGVHRNSVGRIARSLGLLGSSLVAGSGILNGSGQRVACAEWIRPAFNRRAGLLRVERFLNLINYPTYLEAGKALNVSHVILSDQVRQLERDLGTSLLVRARPGGQRPLRLTKAGRRFVRDAREALANLQAAYGS